VAFRLDHHGELKSHGYAWVLPGEHVAPADLAGIVPVAFGIYLVARRPARAAHRKDCACRCAMTDSTAGSSLL
jgi:hypothetical protein